MRELICDKTPDQSKMPYALLARCAVAGLIEHRLGIRLPVQTMGLYLSHWGFMPQKPIRIVASGGGEAMAGNAPNERKPRRSAQQQEQPAATAGKRQGRAQSNIFPRQEGCVDPHSRPGMPPPIPRRSAPAEKSHYNYSHPPRHECVESDGDQQSHRRWNPVPAAGRHSKCLE